MNDHDMRLESVPLKQIHADGNFNCRGAIAPIDVVDLIRDIQTDGKLIQPIVIRRYNEDKKKLFPGFEYGLVAGFRRFTAIRCLKWDTIPAVIHEKMDDVTARIINLKENLIRKDLNIVQEARSIEQFYYYGYSVAWISNELGVSTGWVQTRKMVLDFPQEIKDVIAAGLLTQTQIHEIHRLSPSKRIDAIRMIKIAKERGNSTALITKRMVQNKNTKRVRSRKELFILQNQIAQAVGPNLLTRLIGWAAGEVTDGDFYADLDTYLQENFGTTMERPEHVTADIS